MEVQLGLLLLDLKVEIRCKELHSSLRAFNCRLDVTQGIFSRYILHVTGIGM